MKPLRSEIQIVFQDPFGSLSPRLSIKEIIGEGLEVHKKDLTEKNREKLILDTLRKVELDTTILNRYPHEFSGGHSSTSQDSKSETSTGDHRRQFVWQSR